jgi:hypothetical protein
MAIQFSSAQSRGLATLIEAGAERQVYNSFVMLADVFDVVRFEFDFTDRAVPLNNVDSSDPPLILLFFIFCVAALWLADMWFLKSRYSNQMWQDAQYQVQKTTDEIRKLIKF